MEVAALQLFQRGGVGSETIGRYPIWLDGLLSAGNDEPVGSILPFWLLRRLAKRNPRLLSTTGAVSRSLIVDFLFWGVYASTRGWSCHRRNRSDCSEREA